MTPKGTKPGEAPKVAVSPTGVGASSRYTPPVPMSMKQSPQWVPVLMFALFIVGSLLILGYYMTGAPTVWLLVSGLAMIMGGLFTATKYH